MENRKNKENKENNLTQLWYILQRHHIPLFIYRACHNMGYNVEFNRNKCYNNLGRLSIIYICNI